MVRNSLKLLSHLVLFSVFIFPIRAAAVSYDVTATIPFPAPTQAAVIDPSLDGLVNETDVVEVFGTCEALSPVNIVSIWRGTSLLGSVNCELNGTFRLSVTLQLGDNTLIARSSSLTENYGPDSAPVTINYTPPPTPAPGQPPPAPPSDLMISTPKPFEVINDGNTTTIQVVISGGNDPYTLSINWGDGTTESLVVSDPGTFSFTHTYEDPGIYKVVATVTDVLGNSEVYQFIVSSISPPTAPQEQAVTVPITVESSGVRLYVVLLAILFFITLLLLVIFTSFWLGRRYEYHELKDRLIERPKNKLLARRKRREQ